MAGKQTLFTFTPPHWQAVVAWWFVFAWGFAGCLICFAWVWGEALRRIGSRAMESKEFFAIVVRYAREKKTTRVMGVEE